MDINQLKEFFHLLENHDLFTIAISPPSCGGGDLFNSLAIEGDKILDNAIIKLLQQNGMLNAGEITKKKQQFHNERTLSDLGTEVLELYKFFKPIDKKYQIQKSDIKESIEALIAACNRQNGESVTFQIIAELFSIALDRNFMDFDYISELQMLLQKEPNNPLLQWGKAIQMGGEDHNPIWTLKLTVQYRGETYEERSSPLSNLNMAKRDAARRMFQKLLNISLPTSNQVSIPQRHEEMKRAAQSLTQRQIIFSKPEISEYEGGPMKVSVGTGELLIHWFKDKAKKNPYGTLLLLSTILPEVINGASWSASIESGELCLLNLKIEENLYFETGYGESKSQARKNAANKIIMNSHLYEWLAQKHSNTVK